MYELVVVWLGDNLDLSLLAAPQTGQICSHAPMDRAKPCYAGKAHPQMGLWNVVTLGTSSLILSIT